VWVFEEVSGGLGWWVGGLVYRVLTGVWEAGDEGARAGSG